MVQGTAFLLSAFLHEEVKEFFPESIHVFPFVSHWPASAISSELEKGFALPTLYP